MAATIRAPRSRARSPRPTPKPSFEIWSQDEARVGQKGRTGYIWWQRGHTPRGRRDLGHRSAWIIGAVCPLRDTGVALVMTRLDTAAMIAQGLPVHSRQPRRRRPVHPVQRIGERDQPGADPPVMFAPRLPAQFVRADIVPDRKSRHCGLPLLQPQNLLFLESHIAARRNPLRESASTQFGTDLIRE
jgi:hypothetical protein